MVVHQAAGASRERYPVAASGGQQRSLLLGRQASARSELADSVVFGRSKLFAVAVAAAAVTVGGGSRFSLSAEAEKRIIGHGGAFAFAPWGAGLGRP